MSVIKMLYKPSEYETSVEVDVYSIDHTHDAEGNLVETFMSGYSTVKDTWIVAPIWCFKPIKDKVLTEG